MYTPVFHHVPRDWQRRWQLIRLFAGRVYGVELPEVGRIPKRAEVLEAELGGMRLAPSIAEWVAFLEDMRQCAPAFAGDSNRYGQEITNSPDAEAIVLKQHVDCVQWAVAYADLGTEDPPVRTYGFVPRTGSFALRKSYRPLPVSEFALHSLINFSPWLDGWSNYSTMGAELDNPRAFIEELRGTPGARVGEAFGSLSFVEGEGWVAIIFHGYGLFGRQRTVLVRFTAAADRSTIPEPIRRQVEMRS